MIASLLPVFQSFGAAGTGVSAFLAYLAFRNTQSVKRDDIHREEQKRQTDRLMAQQDSARASWNNYLQFAFDNPQFSSGYSWNAERTLENEKYEWYVTRMLYACEGVLSAMPEDKHWQHVIRNQFDYHCEYLNHSMFEEYLGGYSDALQREIAAWRAIDRGSN